MSERLGGILAEGKKKHFLGLNRFLNFSSIGPTVVIIHTFSVLYLQLKKLR